MKKVTSHVSGLIPSSISKWFGETGRTPSVIRRREEQISGDEDDDDELISNQPPKKRARNISHPAGFTITSTPVLNHNDHLKKVQTIPQDCIRQSNREIFDSVYTEASLHLNGDNRSDSGESTSGYSSVPLSNMVKDSYLNKEAKSEASTSKMLDKCEFLFLYY